MSDPVYPLKWVWAVKNYDLASTLSTGQAFRWRLTPGGWEGVVRGSWVRLTQPQPDLILAETARPFDSWTWLADYLQVDVDIDVVTRRFPADKHLAQAVETCRGLRLLRQDPWECLASFILSSTKQIVQIQQCVELLCQRLGEPVGVTAGNRPMHAFPTAQRVALCTEHELRECKIGFRAPYLLGAARRVADSSIDLEGLRKLPLDLACNELISLPGVGRKIADCVLLFAYGFPTAFPVDVWIHKAIQQLYFPKRRAQAKRLQRFVDTYFGPEAGYAQQYLFHYMRVTAGRSLPTVHPNHET